MKRILALTLALLLTVCLFGCGRDDSFSIGIIGGSDGPTSILVGKIAD